MGCILRGDGVLLPLPFFPPCVYEVCMDNECFDESKPVSLVNCNGMCFDCVDNGFCVEAWDRMNGGGD
jgi:hypothetical protein